MTSHSNPFAMKSMGDGENTLACCERNESLIEVSKNYPHGFFSTFVQPLLQPDKICSFGQVKDTIQTIYQSCPVDDAIFDLLEAEVTNSITFECIANAFLTLLERDSKPIYLEWCLTHFGLLATNLTDSDESVSHIVTEFFDKFLNFASPLSESMRCILVANALRLLENNSEGLTRPALKVLDELIPDAYYLNRSLSIRLLTDERTIKGCYLLDPDKVTLKSMCIYMNHACRSGRKFPYTPTYRFIAGLQYLKPLLDSKIADNIGTALEILENIMPPAKHLSKCELTPNLRYVLIELLYIVVFNDEKALRMKTLRILEALLNAYNSSALYILLLQLRGHVTHSGTLAFIVSKIKTIFLQPVSEKGKRLSDLIQLYCLWRCDEKAKVIDEADHIISSLNVLWYLLVVNKRIPLEIDAFIDSLRMELIPRLTEMVEKALRECHLNLNEIQAGNAASMPEISIQIPVPELTDAQKIESVLTVRNSIEMIKMNIERIVEFFEENK